MLYNSMTKTITCIRKGHSQTVWSPNSRSPLVCSWHSQEPCQTPPLSNPWCHSHHGRWAGLCLFFGWGSLDPTESALVFCLLRKSPSCKWLSRVRGRGNSVLWLGANACSFPRMVDLDDSDSSHSQESPRFQGTRWMASCYWVRESYQDVQTWVVQMGVLLPSLSEASFLLNSWIVLMTLCETYQASPPRYSTKLFLHAWELGSIKT